LDRETVQVSVSGTAFLHTKSPKGRGRKERVESRELCLAPLCGSQPQIQQLLGGGLGLDKVGDPWAAAGKFRMASAGLRRCQQAQHSSAAVGPLGYWALRLS